MPGSGRASEGGLDERREYTRRPCDLEVECRAHNRDHKATAMEISPRGLRIQCPVSFDVGSTVLLSHRPMGVPLGRQRIKSKVIWSKPLSDGVYLAGLQLIDDADNLHHSWLFQVLRKLGMDPYKAFKRKARRIECDIDALMLDPEGQTIGSANILNIGIGGAWLEVEPDKPPTKMFTLVLVNNSGLQLAARSVNQRPHRERLGVNARFLNHPESPEMNKLKSILLELLGARS